MPDLERYSPRVTQLRNSKRVDVEVPIDGDLELASFASTDIVPHLRRFFDALDAEAASHDDDPVALTNAHARMEALLADVRYVRDSIRKRLADRLRDDKIRRLTVSGIATVEGLNSTERTDWRHQELLTAVVRTLHWRVIDANGEVLDEAAVAAVILSFIRPEWRLTPIRDAGLDPDEFCKKAEYVPSVKTVDNVVRRIR